MGDFSLSIESLSHGWADLRMMIDGQEKRLYFEYAPNDPLYELLEGAIKLYGKSDTTIKLHNCSCIEYLHLKSIADKCCIEADDIQIILPLKQFSKAVFRMFDTYTYNYSRNEFLIHWGRGWYPDREINRLREIYKSL